MELKIIPRMSEKAIAEATSGTYVFEVPVSATKQEVSKAVAAQYGVKVVAINTVLSKGKVKKAYRKSGRGPIVGKRADLKKAYVRLAEGDKIAVFTEEPKK